VRGVLRVSHVAERTRRVDATVKANDPASGHDYYTNPVTGVVSWTPPEGYPRVRPAEPPAPPPKPAPPAPLPAPPPSALPPPPMPTSSGAAGGAGASSAPPTPPTTPRGGLKGMGSSGRGLSLAARMLIAAGKRLSADLARLNEAVDADELDHT
jgi:hypothetical protein